MKLTEYKAAELSKLLTELRAPLQPLFCAGLLYLMKKGKIQPRNMWRELGIMRTDAYKIGAVLVDRGFASKTVLSIPENWESMTNQDRSNWMEKENVTKNRIGKITVYEYIPEKITELLDAQIKTLQAVKQDVLK